MQETRQLRHVRHNRLIRTAVLQGDQNFLVHAMGGAFASRRQCSRRRNQSLNPSESSRNFTFRITITAATSQASAFSQSGLAKAPILRRSLVNTINGMTAKLNCRLSTTWLRINN